MVCRPESPWVSAERRRRVKGSSKWYAAHVLILIEPKNRRSRTRLFYENVVLFRGTSAEHVKKKAETLARQESQGDDGGTLTWRGQPARRVFAGIRKVVECQDCTKRAMTSSRPLPPGDGTEVSYSLLRVDGSRNLEKLVRGDAVDVCYLE